jgi:hypothetical protein
MIRTVNLHQLPETRPSLPHLVRRRLFGTLGFPQPFCDHDPAHTFAGDPDAVHFAQLFMRQGRPKIFVLLFQQVQYLLLHACLQAMVARLPAPGADQPFRSMCLIGSIQPLHLPYAQVQHPGGFFLRQAFVFDPAHCF